MLHCCPKVSLVGFYKVAHRLRTGSINPRKICNTIRSKNVAFTRWRTGCTHVAQGYIKIALACISFTRLHTGLTWLHKCFIELPKGCNCFYQLNKVEHRLHTCCTHVARGPRGLTKVSWGCLQFMSKSQDYTYACTKVTHHIVSCTRFFKDCTG